jgi:hypothetical protein
MASGKFDGEIKDAMTQPPKPKGKFPPKRGAVPYKETAAEAKAEGDTPAEMAADKKRGIVEGSPRDERIDMQAMHAGAPAPHQVAAATSIAHAILGHRGVG